jgi:uncharacterized protein
MSALGGHFWTLQPFVASKFSPPRPPPSRLFRTSVVTERGERVPVTGRLSGPRDAKTLVLVVHGLGGSASSSYALEASIQAAQRGYACLRLNLRGADRSGVGVYHAGLYDEIQAAITDEVFSSVERVLLLGYSMGGHTSLRYAALDPHPKVKALATVCSPIDLAAGCQEIDREERRFYRRHVLSGLKEIYAATHEKRPLPASLEQVMAIQTLRAWDELVIAEEFGFESPEDYWAKVGAGPLLPQIEIPTMVIATKHDPMVLSHTIAPALHAAKNLYNVWLTRGGHVGFPSRVDLGLGSLGTLESQAIEWLDAHSD